MRKIVKFVAVDNTEFTSKKECIKYEDLIERINLIMSALKPIPTDIDFRNGGSFVQQNKIYFDKVRANLLTEIGNYIDHPWIKQTIADDKIDPSWVGRLVGDYGIKPLVSAWYRISCIDKEYREWGQVYFRNNPNESDALKSIKS